MNKQKSILKGQYQKNATTLARLEATRITFIRRGTFNLLVGIVLLCQELYSQVF